MKIRIIIPCFNEEAILTQSYQHITKILDNDSRKNNYEYNLLFVDDGSSDRTIELIKKQAEKDKRVEYISLSKNFGKESAMFAGLTHSQIYDAVIIIDCDLQHPPELIPKMIEKFKNGADQVIAKRDRSGEKIIRKLYTKLYYKVINKLVDVPIVDGIGDFRLLSNRVIHSIIKLNESQRFSKGIFSWVGYSQEIINYKNRERVGGTSKWSFFKLLDYGVDGIISFNNKPLRLLLYLGFLICLLSIIYISYHFINILMHGINLPGYFTTIFAVLFLGGVQLISISIIGEYVGRIYYEVKARLHYLIKDTNLNDYAYTKEVINVK